MPVSSRSGRSIAGLIGNDEALIEHVRAASARAGEPTWPLPLPRAVPQPHRLRRRRHEERRQGGCRPGPSSAALLLERFVDDVPWAHLDIAGPARSDEDAGVLTKGGTGFGVRTLLELLEDYGPGAGAGAGAGD